MRTTEYNGEYWYHDIRPPWLRMLRWLVWMGGWEEVIWTPEGVTTRYRPRYAMRLALCARGHRSRRWAVWHSLTPLSLFGHKITFQSFGFHISTRRGYLCVSWPPHTSPGAAGWRVYWSPNATPSSATWWLSGAPREVQRDADLTCLEHAADRAAREAREAAAHHAASQARKAS
jgi:hypothetical protein